MASTNDPCADVVSSKMNAVNPFSDPEQSLVHTLHSHSNSSNESEDELGSHFDPTFVQRQISIKRSASNARSRAVQSSRQLSAKSDKSVDTSIGTYIDALVRVDGIADEIEHENSQEQPVLNPMLIGSRAKKPSLTKSSSVRSNKSANSEYSVKSAFSIRATGTLALGSLQIHSTSPPPSTEGQRHEILMSGDIFVIRDIPVGSVLGYDSRSLRIDKAGSFEGIRDIPPGAHFVWGGRADNQVANRTGFWIMSSKKATQELGEIHVRRWHTFNETLCLEFSEAEMRIQKMSVPEFADRLHEYDPNLPGMDVPASTISSRLGEEESTLWCKNTSSIKGSLLDRVTQGKWNLWEVSTDTEVKPVVEHPELENTTLKHDHEFFSFMFPKNYGEFLEKSSGHTRTLQALDNSAFIRFIIAQRCTFQDSDEIVGEMQFCYITGMLLGNLACMEHWAHIIKTVLGAFDIAVDMPIFLRKVIEALHAQLIFDDFVSDSIFDFNDGLEKELQIMLTTFKSRLNEILIDLGGNITADQSNVGKSFEALESWLWKWGWDLRGNYLRSGQVRLEDGELVALELADFEAEDERGEYAPLIVALDNDGHEQGLVRL